jgi:hypothetical protein
MNTSTGIIDKPIHLTSGFYNKQTLLPETIQYTTTDLILKYARPDGASPMVPLTSVFTFTFNGVNYTAEELLAAHNMTFSTGGSDGYFRMQAPNSFITANGGEDFTVTTEVIKPSSYGRVKYTVSLTDSIGGWATSADPLQLNPQKIEITGRIIARDSYGYNTTLTPSYLRLLGYDGGFTLTSYMTVYQGQYFSDGWYGYPYTILLNTPSLFPNNYFYLYHSNYPNTNYSRTWAQLESSSNFWLTFY